LLELHKSSELRHALGHNARERYVERYSMAVQERKFDRIFTAVDSMFGLASDL